MNENLLWAGGAAVAGIVLGYLLSDPSGPRLLINEKNESVQAELSTFGQVSEAMAVLSARLDVLETGLPANQDAISALDTDLSDRLGKVEAGISQVVEKLDSLGLRTVSTTDRLNGLTKRSARNAEAISSARDALASMAGDVRALGNDLQTAVNSASRLAGAAPPGPDVPLQADDLNRLPGSMGLELTIGQTGTVRDFNLFLSRVDETTARLLVVSPDGGRETVVLAARQSQRLADDCAIALARLFDRRVELTVACAPEGAPADRGAAGTVATAATPRPAPSSVASVSPDGRPVFSGLALGIGQTGRTGDTRFFVRRLRGNAVELQIIGGRRFTLRADQPEDLGNGCTLALAGVDEAKAYIEPTCAE